jgi:hypothetical protein
MARLAKVGHDKLPILLNFGTPPLDTTTVRSGLVDFTFRVWWALKV